MDLKLALIIVLLDYNYIYVLFVSESWWCSQKRPRFAWIEVRLESFQQVDEQVLKVKYQQSSL